MPKSSDGQQHEPSPDGQGCAYESGVQPAAVDAMEACFKLCEVIMESSVSIDDLTEICDMAIEQGHTMIQIALTMMLRAVEESEKRKQNNTGEARS